MAYRDRFSLCSAPAGSSGSKHKPDRKTITSMTATSRFYRPHRPPRHQPKLLHHRSEPRCRLYGGKESLFSTLIGQSVFEAELTEHTGRRVGESGYGCLSPGGTCAMGTVDGDCRVKRMGGLKVVDASIVPLPLGAHYQATVYALAEDAI